MFPVTTKAMLLELHITLEWITNQIFHSSVDNFASVCTTDEDNCTWVLDFLRSAGFHRPFRSRILRFSNCASVIFSGDAEMRHTRREAWLGNVTVCRCSSLQFVCLHRQYRPGLCSGV